jgi:hypothetical protein
MSEAALKKYLAIWKQDDGCGYTIGCGLAVHVFEAIDLDAAKAHVVEQLSDLELPDEIADSIVKIDIYETVGISSTMVPNIWKPARQVQKSAREKALREDKERSEYERLKKKFEQ